MWGNMIYCQQPLSPECSSCRPFFGEVLGKSIILFIVDPSLKRTVGIISEKYQEDFHSFIMSVMEKDESNFVGCQPFTVIKDAIY